MTRNDDRPRGWRDLVRPEQTGAALALGAELRVRTVGDNPWAPPRMRSASVRDVARGRDPVFLGLRPLRRSDSTGEWVQGDLTWDSVRRAGHDLDRRAARWFVDLLSLARESFVAGASAGWLLLDDVESPLVWAHLREGADRGIALVSTQSAATVALASGATRIVLDRAAGVLEVRAGVVIDGEHIVPERVNVVGESGLAVTTVRGRSMAIALVETPVTPALRTLLQIPRGVEVAASEESAFLREAFPLLARSAPVDAASDVRLPQIPPAQATLTVEHLGEDRLSFRFGWDYGIFGVFAWPPSFDAVRDAGAEARQSDALAEAWSLHSSRDWMPHGELAGADAAEFLLHVVPALEDTGIAVTHLGESPRYTEVFGDPQITVSTVESTDPDWFDMGFLVHIDGRTVPFMPLFRALALRRKNLLLADGRYLSLRHPALDRLRELIDEASELAEWETGPRIARHNVPLWEDFEDLAHETLPARTWRSTIDGLGRRGSIPQAPVPATLNAELRPYQATGFSWLAFLWRHRLGGILADDMGLGKTVQLLALMAHAVTERPQRPFLVVAPTSVLGTWREQAAQFAPSLRLSVVGAGSERGERWAKALISGADVVVTSYSLLRREAEELARHEWSGVIFDEAQFLKNPATGTYRAAAALRADAVFAVSGTPLENSLGELWALLSLVAPGLFPSARKFRQDYVQPIEQGKVPENAEGAPFRAARIADLRRRIRPFLLRRTKQAVAPELPPRQEQIVHVELRPAHRAIYDTVLQRERQKVLGLLKDLDRQKFVVFRSLTMLRMLSLAPGLIDADDAAITSAKIEELVRRLSELHAEGHRALVFSQFTSFLDIARRAIEQGGLTVSYLDGSTHDRDRVVNEFRSGTQAAFLISLRAGGFGLTLTEADYVFLLDPWWNPAVEAQAIDRTHRIGQERAVMVYRLVAADTIEDKVLSLQQRKARLFDTVMNDEEFFAAALDLDDIRDLFQIE